MTELPTADSDPQLLAAARHSLSTSGFRIQESRLPAPADAPWLLAENEYFVIAVVAGRTLDDVRLFEGYLAAALTGLLGDHDVGPKRWDAYAVLMARSDASERGRPEVLDLQYNTRSIRRLVCLGVSEPMVDEVLAPFLSLPAPPPGGLPSAYEELVDQLIVHGVEEERARTVVNEYRQSRTGNDG